jgi:hypothetical protein
MAIENFQKLMILALSISSILFWFYISSKTKSCLGCSVKQIEEQGPLK